MQGRASVQRTAKVPIRAARTPPTAAATAIGTATRLPPLLLLLLAEAELTARMLGFPLRSEAVCEGPCERAVAIDFERRSAPPSFFP